MWNVFLSSRLLQGALVGLVLFCVGCLLYLQHVEREIALPTHPTPEATRPTPQDAAHPIPEPTHPTPQDAAAQEHAHDGHSHDAHTHPNPTRIRVSKATL